MKVKILSCEIFQPYIDVLLKEEELPYDYDIEYYEMDQHNHPKTFHKLLQEKINQVNDVDLLLLIYGICGNVTSHISATNCPILLPKVHDCATILLGGKKRFLEVFKDRLSNPWVCVAHDEFHSDHQHLGEYNKQVLTNLYGEDNAAYLQQFFEANVAKKLYVSLGLIEEQDQIELYKDDIELVLGNIAYLKRILWLEEEDLLRLEIGEEMVPLYDHNDVMTKSKH